MEPTAPSRTASAEAEPSKSTPRDFMALIVAGIAVLGFGAFIVFLLSNLKLPEPQWTRAVFLLNGVEAITFAAAGYLFGREVHRGRAENAEKRADLAEDKAQKNEKDANKGRALAKAVTALNPGALQGVAAESDSRRDVPAPDTANPALQVVQTLAMDLLAGPER